MAPNVNKKRTHTIANHTKLTTHTHTYRVNSLPIAPKCINFLLATELSYKKQQSSWCATPVNISCSHARYKRQAEVYVGVCGRERLSADNHCPSTYLIANEIVICQSGRWEENCFKKIQAKEKKWTSKKKSLCKTDTNLRIWQNTFMSNNTKTVKA